MRSTTTTLFVALCAYPAAAAAQAPAAANWTGWYAGAFAGYADGKATGDVDTNTTGQFDDNGFMAGVVGGCRHQTSSNLVIGGELIVPLHIDKGHAVDEVFFPGQVFYESEGKASVMAGINVGYATGRLLPYAFANAGFAHVVGKTLNVDANDNLVIGAEQRDSATPFIWQAGLGLDAQATKHVVIGGRVGYFHVNQADYTMNWNIPGPNNFGWNAVFGQVTITYRFGH